MKAAVLLVTCILLVFGIKTFAKHEVPTVSASAANFTCSDGWRITGYYTPIETDYTSTETREIEIHGAGRETLKESFNADFLKTVFDDNEGFGEGWGKTRFGYYIGEYNGRWHKADAPLDANDHPLEADAVAVDRSVVPAGSIVTIPDLPGDLGKLQFKSTDVGVTVHGKHIDVYTGEGREARRKMWRFTYEDDPDGGKGLTRVCYQPPTAAAPLSE
jgi:3D (Asp-Asp-Asp) domain-containing protein